MNIFWFREKQNFWLSIKFFFKNSEFYFFQTKYVEFVVFFPIFTNFLYIFLFIWSQKVSDAYKPNLILRVENSVFFSTVKCVWFASPWINQIFLHVHNAKRLSDGRCHFPRDAFFGSKWRLRCIENVESRASARYATAFGEHAASSISTVPIRVLSYVICILDSSRYVERESERERVSFFTN